MSTNLATLNPFGQVERPSSSSALAHTDQQRAIAEVQAAMMIARANPRDQIRAMDRILNACQRPTLAECAIYSYSRGGSDVSGPSIRLAEALAQSWGNISYGLRELSQTEGESTVQAYAWDVETNTRREMVFQVAHVRHTRSGQKRLEDPRDIYEMVANQGARRLRACILAIIPGDVTEAAVQQCDQTMRASADTSQDAIRKILEAFARFEVTREQIEARIQRRIDAIQPAQVVALKKIYASLRDGMSNPGDWFGGGAPEVPAGVADLNARIAETAAKRQAPPPEPAPVVETAAPAHAPAPVTAAAPAQESKEWPQADPDDGVLVDARGCPWIAGCHANSKTCNADGSWRRLKGADPATVASREADALLERAESLSKQAEPAPEATPEPDFIDPRTAVEALFEELRFDSQDRREWLATNYDGIDLDDAAPSILVEMAKKLSTLKD